MTFDNPNFNELIEDHELSALLSEPTYFKSINPTCIANFLTSKKTHFMKTLPFETVYQITINLLERSKDLCFPKANLKSYFTAVTKTLIIKSLKKN